MTPPLTAIDELAAAGVGAGEKLYAIILSTNSFLYDKRIKCFFTPLKTIKLIECSDFVFVSTSQAIAKSSEWSRP